MQQTIVLPLNFAFAAGAYAALVLPVTRGQFSQSSKLAYASVSFGTRILRPNLTMTLQPPQFELQR